MERTRIEEDKYFWLSYTVIFLFIAGIVFLPFILKGNSFIRGTDGFNQTYPVLIYIGRYLREWIAGGFKLKEFDFTLGLGEGVISSLSWLGFGDIFTLIAGFIKPEWTGFLFNFIVICKFYFAGVTFSVYCMQHKVKKKFILCGVFFYVFSRFTIVSGLEFYQNLNQVVWIPLLFLGIDHILERKEKFSPVFVLGVFIQALNGFYYLYIETILCVVYFLVSVWGRKENRAKGKVFFNNAVVTAGQYIMGILMAGVFFFPALMGYFGSSRTGGRSLDVQNLFVYPIESFKNFFSYLIVPTAYKESLVVPLLMMLCIIVAIKKGIAEKKIRVLVLVAVIAYLLPLTGTIMNGFSYNIDRWSYVVYFFGAVLVVHVLSEGIEISNYYIVMVSVISALSLLIQLLWNRNDQSVLLKCTSYFVFIGIFFGAGIIYKRKSEKKYVILCAIAVINVCINGLFINGPMILGGDGYSGGFQKNQGLYQKIENSIANIDQEDEDFYRIDSYDSSLASSLVLEYRGATQYFSITNDNIYQFYKQMSISPGIRSALHILRGLDSRVILEALLSVRYYQDMEKNEDGVYIPVLKKNTQEIPFGFLYYDAMSKDVFDTLNDFEKMDVLTQKIVLEGNVDSNQKTVFTPVMELDFDVDYSNIKNDNGRLLVTPESAITLKIPEIEFENGELYVLIEGLELLDELTTDISVGNKDIQVRRKDDSYYIGTDDFLVHVGVPEERLLSIRTNENCTLRIDDLKVYWYPLEDSKKRIQRLSEFHLEKMHMDSDVVSGQIAVPEKAWLFLSIPYSEGWSAKIDGKKAEVYKANIGFMAVSVDEGVHEIVMEYEAPGSRIGKICTVIGWMLFGALSAYAFFRFKVRKWFYETN